MTWSEHVTCVRAPKTEMMKELREGALLCHALASQIISFFKADKQDTLGLCEWMICCTGAILGTGGCLAVSLTSTH